MGKSLCRLCLHKNSPSLMKNVFDLRWTFSDISIPNLLYWSFGIEIHPDDSFTKLVCNKCVNVIVKVMKIRTFFRTNQTILKEKQCPKDYIVQDGWYNTKDIGTNVNFKRRNYVTVPIDVFKNFNQLSIPVCKLEDSFEIKKEYSKVGNIWHKKRKHKTAKDQAETTLEKLDEIDDEDQNKFIKKNKLNDNMKIENKNCDIEADNKIFNKAKHKLYSENRKNDSYVIVHQRIFEQFSSPYVDLETLDNSKTVCKEYDKISDYVYKEIEPNEQSKTNVSLTTCKYNGQSNKNCFYDIDTPQQKTLNGQMNREQNFSNENQKLFVQINNVLQVDVC